jgi:predicted MFS family arabinose efflux permease
MAQATGMNRWWIVVGSVLGLTVGNGPMMQFTFGVFLKPVTEDLGTDRATLSVALLIGLALTGVATPIFGSLVDRFGVRRAALPVIVLFALVLAGLGQFATSPLAFIAIYAVMGVFAAGQTPLPYAKSLAAAFDRSRGLALGIAMAGVGIGTIVIPQIAQALIVNVGWRMAYVGLGAILLVVALPCMTFLVRDPKSEPDISGSLPGEGWLGRRALRTPTFWIMAFAFFALAFTCAGVIAHIAIILTDRGVSSQTAASALSTAGAALIVGRLLAGYLLDRIFAPYVAIFFFVLPLLGLSLLIADASPVTAVAGTILVGLGLGAEVDLIAFLISRYFGMRAFGQIYGYLFAVFMLGSGLGPFVMGIAFTKTGSYAAALIAMAVGLLVAAVLILRLGPYNFAGHGSSAGNEGATSRVLPA